MTNKGIRGRGGAEGRLCVVTRALVEQMWKECSGGLKLWKRLKKENHKE